jgi:hypothetical protein
MTKGIIALDADGVLRHFSLAYAGPWQKTFGSYPLERNRTEAAANGEAARTDRTASSDARGTWARAGWT